MSLVDKNGNEIDFTLTDEDAKVMEEDLRKMLGISTTEWGLIDILTEAQHLVDDDTPLSTYDKLVELRKLLGVAKLEEPEKETYLIMKVNPLDKLHPYFISAGYYHFGQDYDGDSNYWTTDLAEASLFNREKLEAGDYSVIGDGTFRFNDTYYGHDEPISEWTIDSWKSATKTAYYTIDAKVLEMNGYSKRAYSFHENF